MDKEPAKSVIQYLGGARAVAAIVGKHVSRVYRWASPETSREGTGGLIPAKEQRLLLSYARDNDIDLRPDDFHSHERIQSLLADRAEITEAAE